MAARAKSARARKPSDREVREQQIFDGLKGLLESQGVSVTVSRTLDGRGGDCAVRGEPRVIVSRRLPVSDRLEVLADAVLRLRLPEASIPEDLRAAVGLASSTAVSPPA
jgi:hypothetical protein